MIFIRDLGSRNGTFVNEELMTEELLREGDIVRIGSTQVVFESTKRAEARGGELQYEEGKEFKTSLELKVDDLFVQDSGTSQREGEHFRALCQSLKFLQTEKDEDKLFSKILDTIEGYIPADNIYIFLKDENTGAISPRATRQKGNSSSVPISRTILRRVIAESRAILTADAMQDDRFRGGDSVLINQIRSVLCVPIQDGPSAMGAFYAVNSSLAETFDQSDLEFLTALGGQLGASLGGVARSKGRRIMIFKLLARIIGMADPLMGAHVERASNYAGSVARELGQSEDQVFYLSIACILHDMDKLPGRKSTVRVSDMAGFEFLLEIPKLEDALTILESQHERFDGKGKPKGLKGEQIPLGARIITVCSQFDELTRPANKEEDTPDFKPEQTVVRKAFTELGNQANETFDMGVVRALMVAYRHGTLFPGTQKTLEAPPPSSVPEADA
jgi:HD-GYP domain-containing protein (c-di-GMP phosphodiesterase class II)